MFSGKVAEMANDLRLDDLDSRIIALLARDGRMTNAELAVAVGVAPSTTHARVKSLIDRGVISGFHASIDQARLGRGLQAMVGVTLRAGSRQESIVAFSQAIRRLPQVIQVFFVGGTDDFLVHIAVESSAQVRSFVVEHLSAQRTVASTRTSIIFDYHRNAIAAEFE